MIFTPVFTTGLGALPPHLYPHGSAVLGTLQQVAAAIGTAVVVTVLSVRSATLAGQGADPVAALSGGIQLGMVFAAVTAVAVFVLAFFMPGRESAGQGHGPVLEDEDVPRDEQVVA
jgi:MFS transporter, DHA2 family, lincomycin resistance protein